MAIASATAAAVAPLPKERCKSTINLISGDEAVSDDGDEEEESRILLGKERCDECGTAMDSYLVDESRKIHVCGKKNSYFADELTPKESFSEESIYNYEKAMKAAGSFGNKKYVFDKK